MTALLRDVPMPPRVALLPRGRNGYPVPWFVPQLPDGTRDVRIADPQKFAAALTKSLCWVCGRRLGTKVAFVLGPMCMLNRITAEPPCHRDCAEYSLKVCPMLAVPAMQRRRGTPLPDGVAPIPGVAEEGNPGGAVLWMVRAAGGWRTKRVPGGLLLEVGTPFEVVCYRDGRPATAEEAHHMLNGALPKLQEVSQQQLRVELEAARGNPDMEEVARAGFEHDMQTLHRQYVAARRLLPPLPAGVAS